MRYSLTTLPLVILAFAACGTVGCSSVEPALSGTPGITVVDQPRATVERINRRKGTVTVRLDDGTSRTALATSDLKGFEKLTAGDRIPLQQLTLLDAAQ